MKGFSRKASRSDSQRKSRRGSAYKDELDEPDDDDVENLDVGDELEERGRSRSRSQSFLVRQVPIEEVLSVQIQVEGEIFSVRPKVLFEHYAKALGLDDKASQDALTRLIDSQVLSPRSSRPGRWKELARDLRRMMAGMSLRKENEAVEEPKAFLEHSSYFAKQYSFHIFKATHEKRLKSSIVFTNHPAVVIEFFVKNRSLVKGLDTERGPRAQSIVQQTHFPPDLIQIAAETEVILIHVDEENQLMKDVLKTVLRYNKHAFVGVNIEADVFALQALLDEPFQCSFIDIAKSARILFEKVYDDSRKDFHLLQEFGISVDEIDNFSLHNGLYELTKMLLKIPLPKEKQLKRSHSKAKFKVTENFLISDTRDSGGGPDDRSETSSIVSVSSVKQRKTDWANIDLDGVQLAYAAADGLASYLCWLKLDELYEAKQTTLKRHKKFETFQSLVSRIKR